MMRLASIAALERHLPSKLFPRGLNRRRAATGVALCAFVAATFGAADAIAQGWQPAKTVEFVVGSGAGGGNDKTARTMQRIWQGGRLLENVVVVNKVGGGGALAYAYVAQHAGDAHYLAVVRKALLANHILGRSPLNYTDMTVLAIVGNEVMALAVRADSPIRTVKDLLDRLKADPQSVSVSLGSARGTTPHFVYALVAKTAGVDPRKLKVVTFGGAAESVTNLLGGHIDMVAGSVDNVIPHLKSGTVRVLGVSGAQRSATLPEVPTFREQGIDVVQGGWLAVMAPRGLTDAQVAYWDSLLDRAVAHADWKRLLETDALEPLFLQGQAARDYLKKDYEQSRLLLGELGMVK
jgi:putative tricarboxylic transport membrane protein